ncbi:SAVED domain-containing protein [Puniceicoccales bacterium CK1056]|uniref:SAVED domain-containing protein n=1 Tax=Oceanipulchritudo coccoides TaxID=2706888 RepID=A0A6B2LX56_9BACT|nr:SAVED domain-containing protein [Oceanipulchritudo coccoides]NDV61081.1 SAVED domain-containing protein [Oceanipulchritudo coccoides]
MNSETCIAKEVPSEDTELKDVTKSRHIKDVDRHMLWGRSGGRCQFRGCNKPLWKNPHTHEPVNIAEAAHIYSFSDNGPRGNEGIDEDHLNTFKNLLLACHDCHKTIDNEQASGTRYSVQLLQDWKAAHEERVELVTGIDPDHKSHVILYGRAIGGVHSPLSFDRAAKAMFPDRYPAESIPIELSTLGSDSTERDADFWQSEVRDLQRKFGRKVHDRLESREIEHLSVFAIAPMPLLISLGTLLTEIRDVAVYEPHREPKGWAWPNEKKTVEIKVEKPQETSGPPALVFSLSATIDDSRIHRVLGDDAAIWRVTIPQPIQGCIRSRQDLAVFRRVVRKLLDEIKTAHGDDTTLSIFPAAPASTMVELGRIRQPKADMDWLIYDQNRDLGGFNKTIQIVGADLQAAGS